MSKGYNMFLAEVIATFIIIPLTVFLAINMKFSEGILNFLLVLILISLWALLTIIIYLLFERKDAEENQGEQK